MSGLRSSTKSSLARAAFATGLHRRALRDRAVIVLFHRVDDRYPSRPANVTRPLFTEYCDFFKAHFDVIPLRELVARLGAGQSVANTLVITFDDGYRDNLVNAAPILVERQLPATFYIASGWMGSTHVPPWDIRWKSPGEWMTWSEVRELHSMGFEIGAHTISHIDLAKASRETADAELRGSAEQIQQEIGSSVESFAYPFGGRRAITEDRRNQVREYFKSCVSAYGGLVSPGDDPFHLRRTNVGPLIRPMEWAFALLQDARGAGAEERPLEG